MKREQIIHSLGDLKIVAEVGVLRGKFAKHLSSIKGLQELHLIDPWRVFGKAIYGDHSQKTQEDWDKTHDFVVNKFSKDNRVKVHRIESVHGAKMFPDGYFDLVYIDANHSYEAVKDDIKAWMPKVKKGGWLAGHDICTPSVKKAVDEAFDNYQVTTEYDENTIGIKYAKSWLVNIK